MDRNQIIHDLAMEYARFSMKEFAEKANPRTAEDNLQQLKTFYLAAVKEYSEIEDEDLPL